MISHKATDIDIENEDDSEVSVEDEEALSDDDEVADSSEAEGSGGEEDAEGSRDGEVPWCRLLSPRYELLHEERYREAGPKVYQVG